MYCFQHYKNRYKNNSVIRFFLKLKIKMRRRKSISSLLCKFLPGCWCGRRRWLLLPTGASLSAGADCFLFCSCHGDGWCTFSRFKASWMVQRAGSCSSVQDIGVPWHGGRRIWPGLSRLRSPTWRTKMETSPDVCVIFKCTGVFSAKRQGCTVCDFNTVLPFKKKKKVYRFSQTL